MQLHRLISAQERIRTSTPIRAQALNLLRIPFRHLGISVHYYNQPPPLGNDQFPASSGSMALREEAQETRILFQD